MSFPFPHARACLCSPDGHSVGVPCDGAEELRGGVIPPWIGNEGEGETKVEIQERLEYQYVQGLIEPYKRDRMICLPGV